MEDKIRSLVSAGVIVSESLIMNEDSGLIDGESDILDSFLLEASQEFEDKVESRRFGKPVQSEVVDQVREAGVPAKTRQATSWSLNVWRAWAKARVSAGFVETDEKDYVLLQQIVDMPTSAVSFWLPKFVLEARKENGDYYPADSLYNLCCGFQRQFRGKDRPDVNIFAGSEFNKFRQVLDSQMKYLKSTGKHVKKSADIITDLMEDKLWELRLLGDRDGQTLLDTLFYYVGLCFALRGGEEHRSLRHAPSQITLHESTTGPSYLIYEENVSKTNQGGLKHRDRIPKKVIHYENTESPQSCLIQLYKKYNSKCPSDRPPDAFYLKPLKYPKEGMWYQRTAIGHNQLSKIIPRLMVKSGIPGNFTNHSLRSTATTRMFHAGLDEQLIMMRTGHTSTKGVRTYKRANDQLLQETSDVLNRKKQKSLIADKENEVPVTTSAESAMPPSFNITSCTVTINNY